MLPWLDFTSKSTHVAPSTDDVQEIVSTERQIHDALVHGLAAPLGRQVLLRDLRPAQGSNGESDRLVPALGIRSGGVASTSEMCGIINANRRRRRTQTATATQTSRGCDAYFSANSTFLLFSNSWSSAELVLLRVTVFTMPLKV